MNTLSAFASIHSFRKYLVLFAFCIAFASCLFVGAEAKADDGSRLWLRYESLPVQKADAYRKLLTTVVAPGNSATQVAIREELVRASSGMLGNKLATENSVVRDGAIVVGTPKNCPAIANLKLDTQLATLGTEGFLIRSVKIGTRSATVIASQGEVGALYGTFHFLRLMQTLQPLDRLNLTQKPSFNLRVLNHWDNLDGSIERGYAGRSLWNWKELPEKVDARLHDYARANASIGINGSVLNNVNASADSLTPQYLRKTAAIANALRPYGVRVYLSARFSAPIELGGLKTADPLAPEVAAWWKAKADEIYKIIPDFGGFLIKANSEGQPGPLTYKRTHADGANMLAAALAPHKGVVMWRAFVYDAKPGSDRVGQAYDALKLFDGKFASNVLLQVKNGPLDFMPREPFHPLFGVMTKTQLMPELQITQEYLGQAKQLAFLAPMWREFLDSETYAKGQGSTVVKVVDGTLTGQKLTGIAGVANTGSDQNWTGQDLAQANWYAFGRLAWNPNMSSRQIADEWGEMTFTHERQTVQVLTRLLLESREAVVNYMMPLGLTHMMQGGNHYGPQPGRDAATYFHRADANGLGFDRTVTGSGMVNQYQAGARERFASLATCPDEYMLWFHHVPWDYKMRSGRTLWDELCLHYQSGVNWTGKARKDWDMLFGTIDPQRRVAIAAKLAIQERDAIEWRDTCLSYFQTFSKRPLPTGVGHPPQIVTAAPREPVLTGDATKEVLPLTVFKNLQAGKKQTVLVYGTSLSINGEWAKAVKEYFDRQFPDQVTFVNGAKAGMASKWGRENLQARVLDTKPDLVFIEFAINDASKNNGISVEQSRANLDNMVTVLRGQNPQVDIVLQTMNAVWDSPRSAPKKYGSDRPNLAAYYEVYRRYAREHELPLVDNYPNWLRLQQENVETYQQMVPDGIHPSAPVSKAVTWPAVESLLEKGRKGAMSNQATNQQTTNLQGQQAPVAPVTAPPAVEAVVAPPIVVTPPAKENFHIYLLMGQSNMVGRDTRSLGLQGDNPHVLSLNSEGQWVVAKDPLHSDGKIAPGVGPGLSFALEMAKADPTVTIGLVPCAVGGTPLSRWVKGADLYEKAVSRAKVVAQAGVIKGVLWHQGEAETSKQENADTYETRLSQMFNDLRGDLGAPNLPIVVGQLGEFLTLEKYPYVDVVRGAIKHISTVFPQVGFADSEGLGHKGDKLHFSAEAEKIFGTRYAQAMQELQKPQ